MNTIQRPIHGRSCQTCPERGITSMRRWWTTGSLRSAVGTRRSTPRRRPTTPMTSRPDHGRQATHRSPPNVEDSRPPSSGARSRSIGGEGGGKTFNTVEAYNVSTDRWRALATMPTARHGIQAAVCNGGVYIAGGGKTQGGANPTDVHEVFFLDAPTSCTPTGPPPPPTSAEIARDPFDRSVAGGWGLAPVGGSWSVINGDPSNFSVDGSQGSIRVPPAATHSIAALSATDSTRRHIRRIDRVHQHVHGKRQGQCRSGATAPR